MHTTYSFDAWGTGTRNTPRDAYRFARGEAVGVQPYRADGTPIRTLRLRRPLDFAMVSDHAEMLGETELCRTPGSSAYGSFVCVLLRRWPALGYAVVNSQWGATAGSRRADVCGEDGAACFTALQSPWRATREAAEEFYDRSAACRFTPFVGVEWSGTRVGMIHRNIVFRNAIVPAAPPNAVDHRNDETRLWKALESECINAGRGCDVLSIPHNSNWSRGSLFWTEDPSGNPLDAALAARRQALEPLIEITQHKGDSECRAGGEDELCDFETPPFANIAGHASAMYRKQAPPQVYVREGLLEGLREQQRIGVNPFKLGIIGSTDTHLGTPGLVDEDQFVGHGAGIVSARLEVPPLPDNPYWNPGGLVGLWAEENSRDSLFEAMRRREAFGTSGPRISIRFFGGWEYDASLCANAEFSRAGYAGGVPMGGDLSPPPAANPSPTLAVLANRDPGVPEAPGTPLERLQIVKGWLEDGEPREKVFDVAMSPDLDVRVDTLTCQAPTRGANTLCAVWSDPDFDASAPAFYYARAVEYPTCRWSWRACLEAQVDCNSTLGPWGPLAACCDERFPKTIQERAWTSPIWYTP